MFQLGRIGSAVEVERRTDPLQETLFGSWSISTLESRVVVIEEVLQDLSARFQFSTRDLFVGRICLDEALTNAFEHGCGDLENPPELEVRTDRGHWVFRVRDRGPGFDYEQDHLDGGDPSADRGRGLQIIDSYSDRCVLSEGGRVITVWLRPQRDGE